MKTIGAILSKDLSIPAIVRNRGVNCARPILIEASASGTNRLWQAK
jgi:hypothetical protein